MIELQEEKMDKMLDMLSTYKTDTSFIVTKLNMLGANIDNLPSEKNEQKLLRELNALDQLQESTRVKATSTRAQPPKDLSNQAQPPNSDEKSIPTLPSTQTKPPKENSTLVVATLNQAEPPEESSNQTESPNSLNNNSTRTDANKNKSIEKEDTGVQLSEEDLRITLLSDDELNKEVVAFLMQERSDEATELLKRHMELKKK